MNNEKFIPLSRPDINEEDIEEVGRVLRTGMLVQGIEVEKLERKCAEFIGVNNCIAVSNGTATLHLSLLALGIGPGDEVLVPAFSYIATANVVELIGATPVFIDINLETFNIDTQKIRSAITNKTKAIIPVHEFGLAADINIIIQIANKYNLFVIEDAACALGATEDHKYVGSFGHFGSFSLHPRKAISSGEGGMITTNDDIGAEKLRVLRNHGISNIQSKIEFITAGYNYRLTDFQAALANNQFSRIEKILKYKQMLADIYYNEIKNSRLTLPTVPKNKKHSWQTFHILVDETMERDDFIVQLKNMGVGSNYGAQCIPAQIYFNKKYNLNCEKLFPNALKAYKKGVAIPIYEKLSKEDIYKISSIINKI